MISTISLCPICYRKIEARIEYEHGAAGMFKTCPVHGEFHSLVEPSYAFMSERYTGGTLNQNNNIIINIEKNCNMICNFCYFDGDKFEYKDANYYDNLLRVYKFQKYGLMLSGGEPTERNDYFSFMASLINKGWSVTTLTNAINFSDIDFLKKYIAQDMNSYGYLDLVYSIHHPKHYSLEILVQKINAMDNLMSMGKKIQCIGFSIQSLDELKFIREFYNDYKDSSAVFRVRTMFDNWAHKEQKSLYLSQLYAAFMDNFGDLTPVKWEGFEKSTFYCMYMMLNGGKVFSLSSAPTVENIDYHICSRPVNMLANDQKCYPVPIAQIVNEGLSKGWYAGYKLEV